MTGVMWRSELGEDELNITSPNSVSSGYSSLQSPREQHFPISEKSPYFGSDEENVQENHDEPVWIKPEETTQSEVSSIPNLNRTSESAQFALRKHATKEKHATERKKATDVPRSANGLNELSSYSLINKSKLSFSNSVVSEIQSDESAKSQKFRLYQARNSKEDGNSYPAVDHVEPLSKNTIKKKVRTVRCANCLTISVCRLPEHVKCVDVKKITNAICWIGAFDSSDEIQNRRNKNNKKKLKQQKKVSESFQVKEKFVDKHDEPDTLKTFVHLESKNKSESFSRGAISSLNRNSIGSLENVTHGMKKSKKEIARDRAIFLGSNPSEIRNQRQNQRLRNDFKSFAVSNNAANDISHSVRSSCKEKQAVISKKTFKGRKIVSQRLKVRAEDGIFSSLQSKTCRFGGPVTFNGPVCLNGSKRNSFSAVFVNNTFEITQPTDLEINNMPEITMPSSSTQKKKEMLQKPVLTSKVFNSDRQNIFDLLLDELNSDPTRKLVDKPVVDSDITRDSNFQRFVGRLDCKTKQSLGNLTEESEEIYSNQTGLSQIQNSMQCIPELYSNASTDIDNDISEIIHAITLPNTCSGKLSGISNTEESYLLSNPSPTNIQTEFTGVEDFRTDGKEENICNESLSAVFRRNEATKAVVCSAEPTEVTDVSANHIPDSCQNSYEDFYVTEYEEEVEYCTDACDNAQKFTIDGNDNKTESCKNLICPLTHEVNSIVEKRNCLGCMYRSRISDLYEAKSNSSGPYESLNQTRELPLVIESVCENQNILLTADDYSDDIHKRIEAAYSSLSLAINNTILSSDGFARDIAVSELQCYGEISPEQLDSNTNFTDRLSNAETSIPNPNSDLAILVKTNDILVADQNDLNSVSESFCQNTIGILAGHSNQDRLRGSTEMEYNKPSSALDVIRAEEHFLPMNAEVMLYCDYEPTISEACENSLRCEELCSFVLQDHAEMSEYPLLYETLASSELDRLASLPKDSPSSHNLLENLMNPLQCVMNQNVRNSMISEAWFGFNEPTLTRLEPAEYDFSVKPQNAADSETISEGNFNSLNLEGRYLPANKASLEYPEDLQHNSFILNSNQIAFGNLEKERIMPSNDDEGGGKKARDAIEDGYDSFDENYNKCLSDLHSTKSVEVIPNENQTNFTIFHKKEKGTSWLQEFRSQMLTKNKKKLRNSRLLTSVVDESDDLGSCHRKGRVRARKTGGRVSRGPCSSEKSKVFTCSEYNLLTTSISNDDLQTQSDALENLQHTTSTFQTKFNGETNILQTPLKISVIFGPEEIAKESTSDSGKLAPNSCMSPQEMPQKSFTVTNTKSPLVSGKSISFQHTEPLRSRYATEEQPVTENCADSNSAIMVSDSSGDYLPSLPPGELQVSCTSSEILQLQYSFQNSNCAFPMQFIDTAIRNTPDTDLKIKSVSKASSDETQLLRLTQQFDKSTKGGFYQEKSHVFTTSVNLNEQSINSNETAFRIKAFRPSSCCDQDDDGIHEPGIRTDDEILKKNRSEKNSMLSDSCFVETISNKIESEVQKTLSSDSLQNFIDTVDDSDGNAAIANELLELICEEGNDQTQSESEENAASIYGSDDDNPTFSGRTDENESHRKDETEVVKIIAFSDNHKSHPFILGSNLRQNMFIESVGHEPSHEVVGRNININEVESFKKFKNNLFRNASETLENYQGQKNSLEPVDRNLLEIWKYANNIKQFSERKFKNSSSKVGPDMRRTFAKRRYQTLMDSGKKISSHTPVRTAGGSLWQHRRKKPNYDALAVNRKWHSCAKCEKHSPRTRAKLLHQSRLNAMSSRKEMCVVLEDLSSEAVESRTGFIRMPGKSQHRINVYRDNHDLVRLCKIRQNSEIDLEEAISPNNFRDPRKLIVERAKEIESSENQAKKAFTQVISGTPGIHSKRNPRMQGRNARKSLKLTFLKQRSGIWKIHPNAKTSLLNKKRETRSSDESDRGESVKTALSWSDGMNASDMSDADSTDCVETLTCMSSTGDTASPVSSASMHAIGCACVTCAETEFLNSFGSINYLRHDYSVWKLSVQTPVADRCSSDHSRSASSDHRPAAAQLD